MKVRIISAIVAIAIFLPLLYIGGIPFFLLVYAMATIGLYELLKMRKQPLISVQGPCLWHSFGLSFYPDRRLNQGTGRILK